MKRWIRSKLSKFAFKVIHNFYQNLANGLHIGHIKFSLQEYMKVYLSTMQHSTILRFGQQIVTGILVICTIIHQ